MKGFHVMRHVKGLWNGIWSDMFIETTFIRYGHGKPGIIGITLKPQTLFLIFFYKQISDDLGTKSTCMWPATGGCVHHDIVSSNTQTTQKEVAKSRTSADDLDGKGI